MMESGREPSLEVNKMVVDFEVTRTPSYIVASILKIGPYREDNLRSEFGELVSWAKKHRVRTGKWIMYEHDGPNSRRPGNQRRWEACLEIRGKAKAEGRIRIKKLPAQTVAHVVFTRTSSHLASSTMAWEIGFGGVSSIRTSSERGRRAKCMMGTRGRTQRLGPKPTSRSWSRSDAYLPQ